MDTVSVILLTHGDYSGLGRTADSVIGQSCAIDRVILSDDGSGKPFPEEAVEKLKAVFGEKERLLIRGSKKNLGTVAHMNQAAALCHSSFIKFLASGDAFSSEDALERLVSFAQGEQELVTTSNAIVCSEDLHKKFYEFPGNRRGGTLTKGSQYAALCRSNLISAAGTLLHSRFFSEWNGFDESYRFLEDWPAWLRLTRQGEKVAFLPEVTCLYAAGGISSRNADAYHAGQLRADMLRCYEKEILPYQRQLDAATLSEVKYGYDQLCGTKKSDLIRKYPLRVCKSMLKRGVKWSLFRLSKKDTTVSAF